MTTFQIRNLEEHAHDDGRPYFTATVVSGDERVDVHSRFGAWYGEGEDGRLLVLHRPVEFRLAEKTRPITRAFRRAREEAKQAERREAVEA